METKRLLYQIEFDHSLEIVKVTYITAGIFHTKVITFCIWEYLKLQTMKLEKFLDVMEDFDNIISVLT